MDLEDFVNALKANRSLRAVSRACGLTWHRTLKLRDQAAQAGVLPTAEPEETADQPIFGGELHPPAAHLASPQGKVSRYIVTAAQNNTEVNEDFLANLEAYADSLGAEILIAPFTYDKAGWLQHGGQTSRRMSVSGEIAWAPRLQPYLVRHDVQLAEDLLFLATMEMNPTTVNPLSGLLTYGCGDSILIPHPKLAMQQVPVMPGRDPQFAMTTGVVTLRNYIPRKTGLKASFHHTYGALLVEVSETGKWFVRHLNAHEDGTFHDVDRYVSDGEVTESEAAAIVYGDIHHAQLDENAWTAAKEIHETTAAEVAILHDVFDAKSINPHHKKSFEEEVRERTLTLQGELDALRDFILSVPGKRVVVPSNHDDMLSRWLDTADYRQDRANAEMFLQLELYRVRCARLGERQQVFRRALYADCPKGSVRVLHQNDSYVVEGIECALHGHQGVSGARGTPSGLAKAGAKIFSGHTHSASILEGVYTVPTLSKLDMGYNKGLTTWSHGVGLIHPGGKRQILIIKDGEWRL